jgi:hypothetical protein
MPLQFTSTQPGASANYFRYTWDQKLKLTDRYRDSRLLDFSLAPVDEDFVKLERGAYIQVETENFPIWFTGYVVNDPELEYLGSRNGSPVFGYRYQATSDEYILSLKPIGITPAFLNTTQGAILRALAERLAPGVFNLDDVQDGPFIAQYTPDPQKKFFDIVQEFCESSSFLFYARSKALVFAPQDDASMEIVLDGSSQHFTPSRLKIRPGSTPIINDATVLGTIEPQAYVHEYFVGTGLDSAFPLISSVFGVEQSVLLDEPFSSEGIDAAKWVVKDNVSNWLRVEEGYLNCLGGTGSYDDVYVASSSPIPLENKVRFTHGEWDFLSGTGVIAALWTPASPGAAFAEADLVYALKFDGTTLAPIVDGTVDSTQSVTIDTSKRYVIRTIAWFGRERRIPSTYSYLDSTGAVVTITGSGEPDQVAWNTIITEVDPANGQVANQYTFHNLGTLDGTTDAYATYVPVASASLHANVTAITISVPVSAALEMATLPPFKNLGFDAWTEGNPDNWGDATTQHVAEETVTVNSGSALAMTPADGDQSFVAQSAVGLIQAATEYTVICRLRRSTGMTSGALRVQLLGTDLTDSGATFNMVSVPPAEYETFSAKLTGPITTVPEDIELRLYTEGCPQGATLYVDDVVVMTAWQPRIVGPNELDAMDGMSPVATIVAGNTENKSAILNAPQYNPGQAELVFFKDSVNLTSSIPLDNQLLRLSYRSAGAAVARVVDRSSVQSEAVRWGDDGLRSVVRTDLTPRPRTTLECEMAAAALVSENSYGHYEGTYEQWGQYISVEPRAGAILRFENMPADLPGIQAEEISEVVTTLEGKSGSTEFFNHVITFGKPDRIRRLLSRFDDPKSGFQKSADTVTPSAIAVEAVGSYYAHDVTKPVLLGWDANYIYMDMGQILHPTDGLYFEVRYTDEGWGVDDGKNLVLRTMQRKFSIPRSLRGRVFFVRQVFKGNMLAWSEDQTQGAVYTSTASLSKTTALNPDNKYSQICKGTFSTGNTLTASFNASFAYTEHCWSFSVKGPAGKTITAKFGAGGTNTVTLTGFWQRVSIPHGGLISGAQNLVVTYTGSGTAELQFARFSVEGNRLSESGYYKTTDDLYGPTSRYSAAVHVGFPVTFAGDADGDGVVDAPGNVTVVSVEDPDYSEPGFVRLLFRLGVPATRNGFAGVDPWLQSPTPEDTTPTDLTDSPAPRLQNPGWQWFDPNDSATEFDVELKVPAPSRNEKWRITLAPRTVSAQFAPVFSGPSASPFIEFDLTGEGAVYPDNVTISNLYFYPEEQEFLILFAQPASNPPALLRVYAELPDQSGSLDADGATDWDGTNPATGDSPRVDLGRHRIGSIDGSLRVALPEAVKAEMTARLRVVSCTESYENDPNTSPSATVAVKPPQGVKQGSGVEYGPLVRNLTGRMYTEQVGAKWKWWFDLAWELPSDDPRLARVKSWDIVLKDPTVHSRRDDRGYLPSISQEPATVTEYSLPNLWDIADEPPTYRIYVRPIDVDENYNTIVPAITPYVEFTPIKGQGSPGIERASRVVGFNVEFLGYFKHQAQLTAKFRAYWTKPTDPRYGGCFVNVKSSGEDAPGHRATGLEVGGEVIMEISDFPAAGDTWTFYNFSTDQDITETNTYVSGVTREVEVVLPAPPKIIGDGLTDTGSKIRSSNTNSSDLLSNHTFEDDQQLAHWDPNDVSKVVWTDNASYIQGGTGAVLIHFGGNMIHGDRVPCKPGESYVGSAWVKNAGSADGTLRIVVGFMNSAYEYLDSDETSVAASQVTYVQSQPVVSTAPINAAYVYVQLIANSTTGFWAVDTVSLRKQADADAIQDGALGTLSKFGDNLAPTIMWAGGSLPSVGVPDSRYPQGILLIWITNGAKHYRREPDNTWKQTLQPADMAVGTLAAGVAYIGTIFTTQIGSGSLPVGVIYTSTINAVQVNAGTFVGCGLDLTANGIRTRVTNDFALSSYVGVLVETSPSPTDLSAIAPGLITLKTSGVVTGLFGLGNLMLSDLSAIDRIEFKSIGGAQGPLTKLRLGPTGVVTYGYDGFIPPTATLNVVAGWIVGWS